jgi:hypothetical protein
VSWDEKAAENMSGEVGASDGYAALWEAEEVNPEEMPLLTWLKAALGSSGPTGDDAEEGIETAEQPSTERAHEPMASAEQESTRRSIRVRHA